MADWDQNSPADNDLVSQYPANARAARAAVRTNFGVDHREENDGDVGKHEVIQMVAQGSAPTIASGQVGIWNEGGILKTRAGAGAVTDLGLEAGTRMVFYQASAPTGWTAVGSLNDRVLRVNNSTAGNTSGSWTVSGFTVAGHSLTTAQLPRPQPLRVRPAPQAATTTAEPTGRAHSIPMVGAATTTEAALAIGRPAPAALAATTTS
jgi:hypothetical protein